jgi:hypothetical protein
MTDIDSNEIEFQCPSCGNDLKQTIGQLKAEKHMICPGCSIGINIDTDRMANAAEEIHKATEKSPPELDFADFFSCLLQTPAQKIARFRQHPRNAHQSHVEPRQSRGGVPLVANSGRRKDSARGPEHAEPRKPAPSAAPLRGRAGVPQEARREEG